ncbi:hypothetical protein, partial [Salmonella sp. s51228]|uniref:hypothetical protein n=1 Tax=Salmonella sp. s51228 TaxID=3159652 RepID=UPI00397FE520
FTPKIYKKFNNLETSTTRYTFDKLIKNALLFPDCEVGVYAGDEETYTIFSDYLDKIIIDYHQIEGSLEHRTNLALDKIDIKFEEQTSIISYRIRVARNITGFGLSAGITREQ